MAIQALAAVLGGAQSLHTNSFDEVLALPTEDAVTVALRTQQIIAEETGAPLTIDPLGGAYFLERLTDQMEERAMTYIKTIDEMGGIIRAIDTGYPQKEIADAAYRYQLLDDRGAKVVVGVNKYTMAEERPMEYPASTRRWRESRSSAWGGSRPRATWPRWRGDSSSWPTRVAAATT